MAIGRDGAIGCENRLIWPIREDLKHFKALTTGHPVVMGRNTWESLPRKPLPGRLNIVVSSRKGWEPEGAVVAGSLREALEVAQDRSVESPFVIGGGRLYAEALPLCSRLHLTEIDSEAPKADTWFPLIDRSQWIEEERSEDKEAEVDGRQLVYRFVTLRRR